MSLGQVVGVSGLGDLSSYVSRATTLVRTDTKSTHRRTNSPVITRKVSIPFAHLSTKGPRDTDVRDGEPKEGLGWSRRKLKTEKLCHQFHR